MIPVSAITAGFVTILVGYTSSAVLIFQAANSAGATPQQTASWMTILGFAMGVTCIGLSLRYRAPVLTAWSTPGAALLITALEGVSMGDAIGAFVITGLLILVTGITGVFEKVIARLPLSIASAMLAGILFQFGVNVFVSLESEIFMVLTMFVVYLFARSYSPRYAVLAALLAGLAVAAARHRLDWQTLDLAIAAPVFTMPTFSISALINVSIPLFVVTMASQNLPGIAVLRSSGYDTPVSPLVSWTGLTTLLLAPFGCFAVNLAAITAAICCGPESHPDPSKRYLSSVAAGVFYLVAGLFGATVVAFFAAFPEELVLSIAGLALFGAIAGGLTTAMAKESEREPALITFLITASGITLFGIGSAFWALILGMFSLLALRRFRRQYQG